VSGFITPWTLPHKTPQPEKTQRPEAPPERNPPSQSSDRPREGTDQPPPESPEYYLG
jgi:hypothetical protein